MSRLAIQWFAAAAAVACIAVPATAQRVIRGLAPPPAVHTLDQLRQEGFACSRERGAWTCKSGLVTYTCASSTAACQRQPLGPLVRQRVNS